MKSREAFTARELTQAPGKWRGRVCAFSACNSDYVAPSVVSLLSLQRYNPSFDLFLFTSGLNPDEEAFLDSYGIKHIPVAPTIRFRQVSRYPVECFYLFAGPELLHELGYDYSIYIDGDIYCNSRIKLDLTTVTGIAGVARGLSRDFLADQMQHIDKIWNLDGQNPPRIQSGVLFFNNQAMSEAHLLAQAEEIHIACNTHGIKIGGDDPLLAVYRLTSPETEFLTLPYSYNLYPVKLSATSRMKWMIYELIKPPHRHCVFYHFTSGANKPWESHSRQPDRHSRSFASEWNRFMLRRLSKAEATRYFPNAARG